MNAKNIFRNIRGLAMSALLLIPAAFVSCSDDDTEGGSPYFRLENTVVSSKLVTASSDLGFDAEAIIGDATLEEVRKGLVGKIGENMTFRRFTRVEAKGELNSYIHGSKIGVIVDVIGGNAELSHDVAMHIAAAKPKALDETGVDQAQIEAERRIAIEKAREAGKPEAMLERIAEGTVKKFLKEVTLVNQPFVKDDKKSRR